MSIATVHYLSMNVERGEFDPFGAVYVDVPATFVVSGSFVPGADYTFEWGDMSSTTVAANSEGSYVEASHTYTSDGEVTITLYSGSGFENAVASALNVVISINTD